MNVASQFTGMHEIAVEIGEMPVLLKTNDARFRDLLAARYAGFVGSPAQPRFAFDVELVKPGAGSDEDVNVSLQDGHWLMRRGDFRAKWDPKCGRGWIRQSANPYSIDSVLRIVHSLILAEEGGFLMHAASAIRNGRAFLFAGVSGAGKTTIARLAPADTILLTDEVSYVRRSGDGYRACGTPFAGELARVGENCSAPLDTIFVLEKSPENKIETLAPRDAMRSVLRNILFFAEDPELVNAVFQSAFEFAMRVPIRRLAFFPDQRVWEQIA